MKIDLPHVEHTIQVLVSTPEGDVTKILDSSHRSFEIELPDGVREEEVEVTAVVLDECGHPLGEIQRLKDAVTPEPEDEDEDEDEDEPEPEPEPEPEDEDEDDEDTPCEADEEVASSPSDEMVDEEADEEEEELDEEDWDDEDAADSRYGQGCS